MPSLLEVMPLLAGAKLLSSAEIAQLTDAYRVLRKAENALQIIRDEQTHSIPSDPARSRPSVLQYGQCRAGPTALARIECARGSVARQFAGLLFGAPDAQRRDGETALGWLDAESVDIAEELAAGGFPAAETAAVAPLLEAYRHAAPYRRLDESGRRRLHVILERLLKSAAARPSAATVIERVLRVLDAIGARSSYLALLKEQPAAWTG